jgi:hypothetical protein
MVRFRQRSIVSVAVILCKGLKSGVLFFFFPVPDHLTMVTGRVTDCAPRFITYRPALTPNIGSSVTARPCRGIVRSHLTAT